MPQIRVCGEIMRKAWFATCLFWLSAANSGELTHKLQQLLLHMRYNDAAYQALVELNTAFFVVADKQDYHGLMDHIPESYLKSANGYLAGKN